MASAYKPIENYGIIGNLHSMALIGTDGSLDWYCAPHFDSPSVFGALLDAKKGGHFKISTEEPANRKQFYLPDSTILVTRFLHHEGAGEIVDFMPIGRNPADERQHHHLYRLVRVVRGEIRFHVECFPAFNYGRTKHRIVRQRNGFRFDAPHLSMTLYCERPLKQSRGGIVGDFMLKTGESASFVLCHAERDHNHTLCTQPPPVEAALEETHNFWQSWIGRLQYSGRWREMMARSAMTLKLLTFAPTGAIVAAPTTSLPESIGGVRNWDYRFAWIRDASFTLYGLLRLGYQEEAAQFMNWLEKILEKLGPQGSLQVMYGLNGETDLKEHTLRHWEGYQQSKPVRIGNAAFDQRQLDIYGELMDSVYLYNKYGSPISYDLWANLRRLLNYVCKNWMKPDRGIWEVRGPARHFTYSKVMCWVALDRGLRLAQKRSFPADWGLWIHTRDKIYETIIRQGWNPREKAFTQFFGSQEIDASVLMMPLVKFISPTDPRFLSTLARIKETLVSDSLVKRYTHALHLNAGIRGEEGTFSMCTFWYAEALARAGQIEEARWIFEKMLGYANHLGLYAEEIGLTGQQLGNFPQAFTHLGLISAAWNIDKALKGKLPSRALQ